MFMKTVLADGQAEQQVIREMKARAAGARGDIEQIVRGVMADVQQRGWDAVVEYAERYGSVSVERADERHSGQGCRCR